MVFFKNDDDDDNTYHDDDNHNADDDDSPLQEWLPIIIMLSFGSSFAFGLLLIIYFIRHRCASKANLRNDLIRLLKRQGKYDLYKNVFESRLQKVSNTVDIETGSSSLEMSRDNINYGLDDYNTIAKMFSCDLIQESKRHILFLKEMHRSGVTSPLYFDSEAKKQQVFAKYKDWLYQVSSSKSALPLPPPPVADVAWLWHCHRLSPKPYKEFCIKHYGRIVDVNDDHRFQFTQMEKHSDNFSAIRNSGLSNFTVDDDNNVMESIFLSCQQQAQFLWQISTSNYMNDEFLKKAVLNYSRFLKLSTASNETICLVPTYQIDLMWHTHILSSTTKYIHDCNRICHGDHVSFYGTNHNDAISFLVDHDDTLNDRTTGGKLDTSFEETSSLWYQTYGIEYHVDGGMYRGPIPSWYWEISWLNDDTTCKSTLDTVYDWIPESKGYIAGNPKSTTPKVNNNPKRDGYMFGDGPVGIGYYSFQSRQAWSILYQRLCREQVPCFYVGKWLCFRQKAISLRYACAYVKFIYLQERGNTTTVTLTDLLSVDPSLPKDIRYNNGIDLATVMAIFPNIDDNIQGAVRSLYLGAAGCGTYVVPSNHNSALATGGGGGGGGL